MTRRLALIGLAILLLSACASPAFPDLGAGSGATSGAEVGCG
ncbi:hypothetical protein [Pseudolysinimonas sp.]